MAVIKFEDIWIYYQEQPVIKQVNLSIAEGEFLGLIGPNGGGKTTLLKVALGLLQPDRGKIEVFGTPPAKLGAKRHLIGYLPQQSLVDWHFPASVSEVVMMGRYGKIGLFKQPDTTDRQIVQQCLDKVEMAEFAHHQIGQLSGGQQQRVFIARALATEPKLLMLDEPTAGVDDTAQIRFYELLKSLQQESGLTIVLASHDVGIISSYVEKIACLNQTLYAHTTPSEVLATGVLEKTYGCEVELLTHGKFPHRVVEEHK